MIYLDNCATTKMRPEVLDVMIKTMTEDFANPSSLHRLGLEAEKKVEKSRKTVASFLRVKPEEIYWTSGGTEGNNMAIKMAAEKLKGQGKHIITSKIEHPSVLEPMKYLENKGYRVDYLDVEPNGQINLEQLRKSLGDETILVSLMQVNNEIGNILNVTEIGKLIKNINPRTIFHVDGVQGFGKIPINLKASKVDFYSFSGHKIHGPKGIGGLFIDEELHVEPLIHGGHQERGMRSGTENLSSIVAFAEAVRLMDSLREDEIKHIRKLKEYFINRITEEVECVKVNSSIGETSPYILHLSIIGTRGEVLLHYLEQDEIYISTSSACSSNGTEKSHVLRSIGLKDEEIEGAIRICFSYENTVEDMDKTIEKMKKYIKEIRKIMMR